MICILWVPYLSDEEGRGWGGHIICQMERGSMQGMGGGWGGGILYKLAYKVVRIA